MALLPLLLVFGRQGAWAQELRWDVRGGVPVGSEEERFLRVLQVTGMAPYYPWTLRGLTPGELSRTLPADTLHPWTNRYDLTPQASETWEWGLLPGKAGALFNSSIPFGEDDGVVWVGKGFTGVVGGGVYLRFGPLHVRFAPEAFISQNSAFDLAPNGLSGSGVVQDSRFPVHIDYPQRFGEKRYGRLDLGSSAVHLELPGLTLGVSTAGQVWGPAIHYPLLLGNNAGGFPHLLVQTTRPLNLGIARLHGRLMAGRLTQSDFSPVTQGELRRFATGAVVVLLPRGLEGLEIGLGRFAESVWPDGGVGLEDILRPFVSPVSPPGPDLTNRQFENQMATAFLRWTVPAGGVEIYAEITRNDSGRDIRDYLVRPDDLMARVFGLQKVWSSSEQRLFALRAEVVSAEVHHSERGNRFRKSQTIEPQPWPSYWHDDVRQGHTQHGQILGSPTAYGGAGWTVGVDLYHPGGRWTVDLSRTLRGDWLPGNNQSSAKRPVADVIYSLSVETLRFTQGLEVRAGITPAINLSRNLEKGNDVFNLRVTLGIRGLPR